jgi:aspartyl-tRNA(Asn)/glutamyl-tRNA(Gln) amidotransferase subunit A
VKNELCDLGVMDLSRLYRRHEVSPVEVVQAHLERCERLNPVLNSYLVLLREEAIEAARAMERLFHAGVNLGPLQGVPVSVKDLIRVKGKCTTGGSRILLQELPDQEDALVIQRLRAAGAIIIGKTNLYEFASGDPDPHGPFGVVQNPRRIGHQTGYSSSGAGAATAAGMGVIALGTDTGGSIRIPACLCGVSGLKPTTGLIPMDGIIPLSHNLDTVGPLARRVSDITLALRACTGDPKLTDSSESDFLEQLDPPLYKWRIGVPRNGLFSKTQQVVSVAFKKTLTLLSDFGCQLIDFDPPAIETMPELVLTIVRSEAAAYHERYRGREHLYGPSFRNRIYVGREIKAVDYLKALRKQSELQQRWLKLFQRLDLVVTPSGPAIAPPHGTISIDVGSENLSFRDLSSRFTNPFNLLGWPALSMPNSVGMDGLPTGIQIAGPPYHENQLLLLGHHLEKRIGLISKLGIEPCHPAKNGESSIS